MKFYLLSAALIVFGCKKPNTSEVKTLDNFVGEFKKSDCSAPGLTKLDGKDLQESKKIIAKRVKGITAGDVYDDAIFSNLSSIPYNVQRAFFSLNGTIHVSDAKLAECRKNLDEGEKIFINEHAEIQSSCWQSDQDALTLYLPRDLDSINHGFVRGFGRILIDGMALQVKDGQGIKKERDDLVAAFEKKLTQLTGDTISDERRSYLAVWKRLRPESYGNAVFAESFDSFYCNDATHQKMQENFPFLFCLCMVRMTRSPVPKVPKNLPIVPAKM